MTQPPLYQQRYPIPPKVTSKLHTVALIMWLQTKTRLPPQTKPTQKNIYELLKQTLQNLKNPTHKADTKYKVKPQNSKLSINSQN